MGITPEKHSTEFRLILALQDNFANAWEKEDFEKMEEIFEDMVDIASRLQGFKDGVLLQKNLTKQLN